jgi:hypothetical protein
LTLVVERCRTNRWTGAAVARFASSLGRRSLNEFAPPGQLKRYPSPLLKTREGAMFWLVVEMATIGATRLRARF